MRPQFALKTMLWVMALVGAFCFGFIAGGGRERRQLEAERRRLVDQAYELEVEINRRGLRCGSDLPDK
jgi:hypothetical protein